MTRRDRPRDESDDGRVDAEPAAGDESDGEREGGRYDKYVEYLLDLLSFL